MVDVPLDRVEVHEDGRGRAVRIDLVVDGVDACHQAARAVAAVVVTLKSVDAVNERTGLFLSVGVLLDECKFRLDGVGRFCRKCRAEGCERKYKGQYERTDFFSHGDPPLLGRLLLFVQQLLDKVCNASKGRSRRVFLRYIHPLRRAQNFFCVIDLDAR